MRGRPRVKLTLESGAIYPGQPFVAELAMESGTATPCDFVDVELHGYEEMWTGEGNTRSVTRHTIVRLSSRHEPGTLSPGTRTLATRFVVPPGAPASFDGVECKVHYICNIHISIPWWPDRRVSYAVPVRWPPRPVGEPAAQTFATNREGPLGTTPYMEASLDRTEIVAGEMFAGSLSMAHVAAKTIRKVEAKILGIEHRNYRGASERFATKFSAQIHEGGVPEGEPVRFRLGFPKDAPPSFQAHLFRVDYQLELRADVAWGSDVVLRIPVVVQPRDSDAGKPAREGRVAPVGRERRAVVWAEVASRLGFTNDPEQERMLFNEGDVTLVVQTAAREDEMFVAAELAWPPLGIDLTVGERQWTSLFGDHVDVAHRAAAKRFTIHAREAAQAQALLTAALLDPLAEVDEVLVDDRGARLAHRGNAQVTARLLAIVGTYQAIARAFAVAIPRVPPPAAMAAHLPAWEAFATRVQGRLERGRMWIRGVRGADVVEVGTLWGEKGTVAGTRVAVVLEPPIEVDLDAPTVSPAARAALQDLAASAATHHTANALAVLLPDPLPDPEAAEPWLERLGVAARALRGQTAAGPFR